MPLGGTKGRGKYRGKVLNVSYEALCQMAFRKMQNHGYFYRNKCSVWTSPRSHSQTVECFSTEGRIPHLHPEFHVHQFKASNVQFKTMGDIQCSTGYPVMIKVNIVITSNTGLGNSTALFLWDQRFPG